MEDNLPKMSDAIKKVGYFLFTLDTELGWGTFDKDEYRYKTVSPDGSRERKAIKLLLDILEEFGIIATWAVVGHLFYDKCEQCEICPILEWEGKYTSFNDIYKTAKPLWYGADLIEILLSKGQGHEIAFHGYTHKIFDENIMSPKEVKIEIQEWLRVSRRREIIPRSVIFPRDKVGYLDLFKEAGFICYRSDVRLPLIIRNKYFGHYIKHIDHILNLSSPPVYDFNKLYDNSAGLVNLPSSQYFFGFNRKIERILDSVNLHRVRINRMIKGVKKAADEKKIIHIWAHPWGFRTPKDFEKLRYLLNSVTNEIDKGRLQSVGMADLARKALADREEK